MKNITEQRRASLINITYFAVIAVAFFLFMKYAFWLLSPFIFALFISVVLQKPINAICEKTHIKKGAVASGLLIMAILLLLGAISLIGYKIIDETQEFIGFIKAKFSNLPELIDSIHSLTKRMITVLPDSLEQRAGRSAGSFFTELKAYAESGYELSDMLRLKGFSFTALTDKFTGSNLNISSIASPLISTAAALPGIIVSFLIFIIASFFLTTDYDSVSNLIKKNMKKETADKFSTAKKITLTSLGLMIKSYLIIICITFCEMAIGLNILKLFGIYESSYIILISLCTALLDILPVFGTGTVLIPWAIYSLIFGGNVGLGIGLIVIYAVITVVRQIVEPRLVGANLGLHPIFTLMGMYVGLQLIGVLGMFVMPITMVVIKMLNDDGVIHLWGENKALATEEKVPEKQKIIKPVVSRISSAVAGRRGGGGSNRADSKGDKEQPKAKPAAHTETKPEDDKKNN